MSSTNSTWLSDAFKSAREDFLKDIKHPERYDFSQIVTIDDVYKTAGDIQKVQAQTKTLRGLNRIRPFLDALNQFSGTIEVFVQVKPDILALLWGPVKFLLQISSALGSAFDKVVQVLADIGNALPLFQKYHSIFQDNEVLKMTLSKFYVDILEVYKILINFMHDRRLKTFLEPLWPSIRNKLSVVENNIKGYVALFTDHVTLEHIMQADQSRTRAMQEYDKDQAFRDRQEFQAARLEFSPELYDRKLSDILEKSWIESGSWLETQQDYVRWAKMSDTSCRLLWLQGIPGSGEHDLVIHYQRQLLTRDKGKTFLSANIAHRLQRIVPGRVLSIFLINEKQDLGRVIEVFHSILFQAATQNETLKPVLLGEIRSNSKGLISDIHHLKKFTADSLTFLGQNIIVIDGLDEIEESARRKLLEALLELLDASMHTKILLSSRAERDIEKALGSRAIPFTVHTNNQGDIQSYAESQRWLDELTDNGADDDMVSAFRNGVQCVLRKSQGMFLYTKLVLELLKDQGTAIDIQNELQSLPDGLDQAYGRILERINEKLSQTRKAAARKVLQWLACALRPLREEEILQILVVEPNATNFPRGKRYNADIRSTCGPIIEVVGGIVRFVHFSAKEYLTDKRVDFLDLQEARLDAAVTCSSYLCHRSLDLLFNPQATSEEIERLILSKEYVFFDYAATMWLQHISLIGTGAPAKDSSLNDVLSQLLKARDLNSAEDLSPTETMLHMFETFRSSSGLHKLLAYSYKVQGQLQYGEFVEDGTSSGSIAFRLFRALKAFRTHREDLYCEDVTHEVGCDCPEPLLIYGPPLYFCEEPFCTRYKTGFSNQSSRDQHTATHQRTHKCPHPDCLFSEHGFYTQVSLNKHQETSHGKGDLIPGIIDTGTSKPADWVGIDEGDLISAMEDAIIHSDLDTVQTLLRSRPDLFALNRGNIPHWGLCGSRDFSDFSRYCLCLAAWKSTTEVLSYIHSQGTIQTQNEATLHNALATAIETMNLPNIKYLFSFNPSLTNSPDLPEILEKAIRSKRRYYGAPRLGHASRALSLWDPNLMEFLVSECHVVIPSGVANGGDLFRNPAISNLEMEEVRDRFEMMRKYVNEPEATKKGVWPAVKFQLPKALQICLENGGDPNSAGRSRPRKSQNVLARKLLPKTPRELEVYYLLLKHGRNPEHLDIQGKEKDNHNRFERDWGVSWKEFTTRASSAEDLEIIVPKWRRK